MGLETVEMGSETGEAKAAKEEVDEGSDLEAEAVGSPPASPAALC